MSRPNDKPPELAGSEGLGQPQRRRSLVRGNLKPGNGGGANLLRRGTRLSLCRACGVAFRGVREFDVHRTGPSAERRCLTTPEMSERGLTLDPRGFMRLPRREYAGRFGVVSVAAQ